MCDVLIINIKFSLNKYNTIKGVNYDRQTHYFLHIGRGKYQYVGKNYQYKGNIEQYPQNKKLQ